MKELISKITLENTLKTLCDLLYPENLYCLCCGDTMQQNRIHGICDNCADKIQWVYSNPYLAVMDEHSFSDVISCCRYGFYERKIMNSLKNNGQPYIAKPIGKLMAERVLYADKKADLLVCVPVHPNKLAKRGYNQSDLLAKQISADLNIPYINALEKITETRSMRGSGGIARRTMLEGSIVISEMHKDAVIGKSIFLVDDVITTGSTADICSRALLAAGAKEVSVLCFASASG